MFTSFILVHSINTIQYNHFFPRLAGSYEALEAGNTGDALVDFTGGVCESINLKDGGYGQDTEKRQALFKSMERAMREKSLISASIRVCFSTSSVV